MTWCPARRSPPRYRAAFGHNRGLLATLSLAQRIKGPIEYRAAGIGAIVGLLAWTTPHLVGGGDDIAQKALSGELFLVALPRPVFVSLCAGCGILCRGNTGRTLCPIDGLVLVIEMTGSSSLLLPMLAAVNSQLELARTAFGESQRELEAPLGR